MFAQQAFYLLSHVSCFVSSFRTHLPQHLQHLPNCILTHLTPSQMLESEVPSIAVLEMGSCITMSLNRWHQGLIYCTRSSSPQHAVEKGLTDSVSKPRRSGIQLCSGTTRSQTSQSHWICLFSKPLSVCYYLKHVLLFLVIHYSTFPISF